LLYQIDSLQKYHFGTFLTFISSQITIDQKRDILFSLSKSESNDDIEMEEANQISQ